MSHQEKTMRRKKKTFALKLIAAAFITLMLLRTDWLTSVIINSNKSEERKWNMPEDFVHDKPERKSILREILNGEERKNEEDPECPNPRLNVCETLILLV
jgi:hypothetical protein